MAGPIDKAVIVNWALTDLGLPPSFTLDTADEVGRTVDLVWQRVVDRAFGLHDWTFCRKTFLLNRQSATPVTGYAYAFDLPGGTLGEPLRYWRDARCSQPVRDFQLEAGEVHANEATLYARAKVYVDPQTWEPGFRQCFVTALASALAVPLTQDPDTAAELHAAAFGSPSQQGSGGAFGRLIAQNRAADPPDSPIRGRDPLLDARWA